VPAIARGAYDPLAGFLCGLESRGQAGAGRDRLPDPDTASAGSGRHLGIREVADHAVTVATSALRSFVDSRGAHDDPHA